MIKSLRVRDYMTEHPVTLPPDMAITEAIAILVKNKISGATVVNGDGKIIGVLSEIDCLRALRDGSYYGED
ncbi:MAG: CBS domain-containing protein, partial [Candidatus Dadabacteria bacterium]